MLFRETEVIAPLASSSGLSHRARSSLQCWLFSWVPFAEQNLSGELPYSHDSTGLHALGCCPYFLKASMPGGVRLVLGSLIVAAVPLTRYPWLPMAGRLGMKSPRSWGSSCTSTAILICCNRSLWVPPHSPLLDECSVSLAKRNLSE